MPEFRYLALDAAGLVQRGTMEAVSEARVIEALQRQGFTPMRAEPVGRRSRLADMARLDFSRGQVLRGGDVASVTRELATMLGAGQSLDQALRFLIEIAESDRIRRVMSRVREKVRNGSPLAAALAAEPKSFTRLYVSIVQAGEAGGKLAEALDRMAVLLERQRSLTAAIQSAMIYPALLVIAAVASIAFLLTKVLPQFVPLFAENGAKLPTATRILIAIGDFTADYGLWLLLSLLIAAVLAVRALRDPKTRRAADGFLLKLPVIGGLQRQIVAARLCRTLGTLLVNGVPLIAALTIARETLGNLAAADAVDRTITRARGGAGVSRPLGDSHIFPARMIHLLRLGEEAAQLGPLALKAAEIHEEQTRLSIQRLVALLTPAITVAMGAAVAFIVGALLVAMLSLNDLAG